MRPPSARWRQAYDAAWNAADLPALTAPFTPDAMIIDPFGGVSFGRAAIARLLAPLLAGSGRGSTHASTIHGVSFVSDDVALADGEAVIEGLHDAEGNVMPTVVHRFTDVLVAQGGLAHRPGPGVRVHGWAAAIFRTGHRREEHQG